ncbi:MAG TPA: hypothetical protein VF337_12750 [Candidatus Limnocylindrales bacterium]
MWRGRAAAPLVWGAVGLIVALVVCACSNARLSGRPSDGTKPVTGPTATTAAAPAQAILITDAPATPGVGDGDCCAYGTRRPYALVTARPTPGGVQVPTATSQAPAGNIRIGPKFDEQVVDSDQDGLIDQLVLITTIEVPTGGQYMVNIRLEDASGYQVQSTGTGEISLVSGSQPLKHVLEGKYIYQWGRWGPYTPVVTVVYFGRESKIVLQDSRLEPTHSYDYRQFQHERIVVDPRSLTAEGADTNGDGLYDQLRITGIVNVEEPGVYAINSGLYGAGPFGQVAAEYMTFQLSAGPNIFTVVYKGSDIAKSGQDGPYTVFDFAIYVKADPMNEIGSVHPNYVTPAFKVGQFGG